jgi:Lrp/AsnC ligand binding domain
MVAAYVLIQTEVGKAGPVARAIAEIKGVHGVEAVAGPYDVIARAEARGMDDLAGSSSHRSKQSTASHAPRPARSPTCRRAAGAGAAPFLAEARG